MMRYFEKPAHLERRSDGWYAVSEKGNKNLGGPYKTETEAKKRLSQVEYFKKLRNHGS